MTGKPPNAPLRRSPWRTSCRTQARINKRELRWLDTDRIGQELAREHPETIPDLLGDADLQKMVTALKNFNDSPFPPNAMYLDLIRTAWEAALQPEIISTSPPIAS